MKVHHPVLFHLTLVQYMFQLLQWKNRTRQNFGNDGREHATGGNGDCNVDSICNCEVSKEAGTAMARSLAAVQ